ncbi:hypothetical protein ABEB36_006082 [Hypothenemus hampei]|uniref:Uncharacterized protein n=1 Tax=Hypothenemus hampei TaxID=57062 RepID=A0ABD1F0G6_HYPHA
MSKLVYISLSFIICVHCSMENSTLSRFTRQSRQCKKSSQLFQCSRSSECIDIDKQCDGREDCLDGSDETLTLCRFVTCPSYLFRCDYGACIGADLKCDGQKDCADNSDENICESIVPRIDTNCRSDQFECNNGQCINIDGRCNGTVECQDETDETEELCLNTECPGYTHKCKYGACVDGDAECNGKKDCADNSDEDKCDQTTPPQKPITKPTPTTSNTNQCVTPQQPDNGKWVYFNDEEASALPNVAVSVKTQLLFKCNPSYKLSSTYNSEEIIYCREEGQWSLKEFPTCEKLCPKQYNKNHATVTCTLQQSVIPCDMATHGTELTYKCDHYYEPAIDFGPNICRDGTWSDPDPKCTPKCGEKRVSAALYIVNGHTVKSGDYPWVTAIYSNRGTSDFINICGGSLLSRSVVLTAAHCVTYQHNGQLIHKKFFQVAAGKYYNSYGDERDKELAQYSKVREIVKHEDYQGEVQNFRFDIAILKLEISFALSKVLQPVCLNFNLINDLRVTSAGTVTGWGYTTSTGKPADELKEIDLPFTDNERCRSELDPDFAQKYLVSDKFCAGYVNKNMSVCKGDSGGGLVMKNSNGRYFIQGIVSLGHSLLENNQRSCNVQKRALFTNVNTYMNWIKKQLLL